MNVREFQKNRARFSWDELRKYDSQWVAFSADGSTILASNQELERLVELIVAAGAKPVETPLEYIELVDYSHLPPEWCGNELVIE